MNNRKDARIGSDTVKLLTLAAILAAVLAVAYVSIDSDETSAATVDGTTYFYDQLTANEKKLVDQAVNFDIEEVEPGDYSMVYTVDMSDEFKGQDPSALSDFINVAKEKVLDVMLWERIDYFWLTNKGGINLGYSATTLDGKVDTCTIEVSFPHILAGSPYGTTKTELLAQRTAVYTLIDGLSIDTSSRLTAVEDIHEYVCANLYYTEVEPVPQGMEYRNIYDALIIDGEVVCEGYSRAFKAICDYYNIPCILITGTGVTSEGSDGHMWNQVQMDNDRWYLVDCTWDDRSTMDTTYFLAGTTTEGFDGRTVAEDHLVSTTEYGLLTVPSISSKGFNNDKYTWTFINYDDSVIETITDIAYETESSTLGYPTNPTYTDPLVGTFTFTGWSPEVPATVTKDMRFKAQYNIDYVEYTLTFHPENGEADIVQSTYHYNDTVTLPTNPVKAPDSTFSYKFSAWSPSVPENVTEDLEFTAVYEYVGATVVGSDGFEFTSALKTALADADKFTVNLNTDTGGALAKITFNKTAIDGFTAGETLTVTAIDVSAVDEAVRDDLDQAKIFRIDFGANNTFASGGKATVALYYEKSAIDRIAGITLYYVNDSTHELEQLGYNYEGNYVVFETEHFSDYAIKSVLALTGIYWYIPIVAILLFAVIGFALAYRYG